MSKNRDNELGALWTRTKQDGSTYYTGTINGEKVVIWANSYKQPGERSPDWRVYRDTREPRQDTAPPQPDQRFASPQPPRRGPQRDDLDDTIPF